jgi:hypothetical protein
MSVIFLLILVLQAISRIFVVGTSPAPTGRGGVVAIRTTEVVTTPFLRCIVVIPKLFRMDYDR